jgi:succinyl-CoA synthetase beta subunit
MKLQEYEALRLFASAGVKVPKHILVKDVEGAVLAYRTIGGPVVLKAQVTVAGRGKAGGVVKADSESMVRSEATRLLNTEIKGLKVKTLLVEEWIKAKEELYLGFTIDRAAKMPVVLASKAGGVDLEDLIKSRADLLVRKNIDPLVGFMRHQAYQIAKSIGLKGVEANTSTEVMINLYTLFQNLDCELLESNPLALTEDGSFVALDARIIIDDNALSRHSEFAQDEDLSKLEIEAKREGLSYVELEGDIAVVGNGAGLVMATVDTVTLFGGKPACFLDVGGGAREEVVEKALKIALRNPKVKVLLLNVLGGITRCDEVARGLVKALSATKTIPAVVRLVGVNEEEGRKILREACIGCYESLEEAAEAAVKAVRGD